MPASQAPQLAIASGQVRLLGEAVNRAEPATIQVSTEGDSFSRQWKSMFPGDKAPRLAFDTEVAIFFHVLIAKGCPNLGFQGLGVDPDKRLVYGVVAPARPSAGACLDIAGSQSFVVGVDRSRIPRGTVTFRVLREFQLCSDCGREGEQVEIEL